MNRPSIARASSLLLVALAAPAPCGCAAGGAERTSAPSSSRAPSPGPRAEDTVDDPGLAAVEADARGRGGDDGARAELRLLTDQVRAFVVAVVHAMPLGPTHAGAANEARFDPPATLARQLGSPHECEHNGEAHACAERLATRLLERINVLVPPHELAGVKDSLLTAMAALEEGRVPVPTEVRWRVLRDGDDPAAHLAQALTLVVVSRHVGQCLAAGCSASQGGQLAAALSEELAIGPCSDALQLVIDADPEDDSRERAVLAGLAHSECAPACAHAALASGRDEPFASAAQACRAEHGAVPLAPYEAAAREIATWRAATRTRLTAVEAQDVAVRDVLQGRAELPAGTTLAMSPPLFWAGDGFAVALPPVHDRDARAVSGGTASAIVWLAPSGDAVIEPAPRFALDPSDDASSEHARSSTAPLDGLHAALEHADASGTAPRAVAIDPATRATRIALALGQSARGAEGPASLVELAVRHGAQPHYIALRIVPTAAATHVLRVSERQLTFIENGVGIRTVDLVPPTAGMPDTLGGAAPADGTPTEQAIELEPDTSGATFVRVAEALAVAGGHANPTIVPGFVAHVAEGAVVFNVADAARATALRTAVDSHRAEAMRCLEPIAAQVSADELGATPARVDLHLVLDAHGRTTAATAASLSARDAHVAQCVQTAAHHWHLPAAGAAEVRVSYVLLEHAAPAVAHPAPPPAHPALGRVH